jgi:hypothetical protein
MKEGGTSPACPVRQLFFPSGKIIPLGEARPNGVIKNITD